MIQSNLTMTYTMGSCGRFAMLVRLYSIIIGHTSNYCRWNGSFPIGWRFFSSVSFVRLMTDQKDEKSIWRDNRRDLASIHAGTCISYHATVDNTTNGNSLFNEGFSRYCHSSGMNLLFVYNWSSQEINMKFLYKICYFSYCSLEIYEKKGF